ncbi:MAG: preprotein translocase subunit YajC [Defluviitaleaceae bacterium]|nr:preprotein translocase subunit YajC [Defluviitaleaceae bacterium]
METYVVLTAAAGNTVIYGGQGVPAQATGTEIGAQAPPAEPAGLFGAIGWNWILIYIAIFGGYIWFMMRNNRKKQQKLTQMRDSLKVGDDVCTTGGLFGKIVGVEENAFVVEFGLNKGIRIPVLKSEVVGGPGPELKDTKIEKE